MSGAESRAGGSSFLVRLWREPRGGAAVGAPSRVFVRDLRSGEERYLKDVEGLADYLEKRSRRSAGRGSRPGASGGRRAG